MHGFVGYVGFQVGDAGNDTGAIEDSTGGSGFLDANAPGLRGADAPLNTLEAVAAGQNGEAIAHFQTAIVGGKQGGGWILSFVVQNRHNAIAIGHFRQQ